MVFHAMHKLCVLYAWSFGKSQGIVQTSDQFKHADIGFVEDCFLCTPQYIFKDGGNIHYGIKCLKKDSSITLADAVMGTHNVAEMLFSKDLLTIPVYAIDMVYLNRITGCPSHRVPRMHKTYIDAEGLTWCQQGNDLIVGQSDYCTV